MVCKTKDKTKDIKNRLNQILKDAQLHEDNFKSPSDIQGEKIIKKIISISHGEAKFSTK